MAGAVVDLFMLYQFLKRLTTPFNKWDAYKEGIIDEKGTVLKKRKDLNKISEREAFGLFDVLVLNLKKLLEKVPGGKSRIGTYAAALLLLKEDVNKEYSDAEIESLFEEYVDNVSERLDDIDLMFEQLMDEDAPTMSAGSGGVAGIGVGPKGEPGVSGKMMRRYKMKNAMVYMMDPSEFGKYKNKTKTFEDFQNELETPGVYPTFVQDEVTGALYYLGRP